MNTRLLSTADFDALHSAFCLAFSRNKVEINPTREQFDYRIHQKLNIDYSLSAGSYDGDELVGFILHTHNIYEGIPTAFNGGTGVIPGFRNQKIGEEIYEFLLPRIIQKSLARVLLEVIDTNETAIRLYEKVGFSFRRRFLCYKMTEAPSEGPSDHQLQEGSIDDLNEEFMDFEPSFIDSKNQLAIGSEKVLLAMKENQAVAYLVFQPKIGRISQIAISGPHRHQGIGSQFIREAYKRSDKMLSIMNVPENELALQRFLQRSGFVNQVNQFEMELII